MKEKIDKIIDKIEYMKWNGKNSYIEILNESTYVVKINDNEIVYFQ